MLFETQLLPEGSLDAGSIHAWCKKKMIANFEAHLLFSEDFWIVLKGKDKNHSSHPKHRGQKQPA